MTTSSSDSPYMLSRRTALAAAAGLLAAGPLAACGTSAPSSPRLSNGPSPAPDDEPIGESVFDTTPENQAATFRHVDRQPLATRIIRANPARSTPLSRSQKSLEGLRYSYKGTDRTLDRWVADNRVAGLLALKDGAIVHEQYAMGNTETSKWESMSVAKSVTGTLVGAALADGAIGGLDDPIPRYVPELKNSVYDDNTIRQLMQMSSGLKWVSKPYTLHGDSDIARLFQAVYSNRPGAAMEYIRNRPRVAAPGSVFNYANGDSYVLGAVVAGATGKTLSDYLSEKIWRPVGMEADAYWMLDAPGGLEMGGNSISATLRDYARFGQFILTGSEGVLPKGWRDEAGRPSSPITDYGRLYSGDPEGYGYQWWAIPSGVAGAHGPVPTFMALGHGGQKLYINPAENVVVVQWSAWRDEESTEKGNEFLAVLDAMVKALH